MSTSTEYAVLIVGDETTYQAATPEEHTEVMQRHMEFARLLAERGHTVTAGAELTASTTARVLRDTGAGHTVTDGPFAEGAEQLGGFYTVRTSDLDDLVVEQQRELYETGLLRPPSSCPWNYLEPQCVVKSVD